MPIIIKLRIKKLVVLLPLALKDIGAAIYWVRLQVLLGQYPISQNMLMQRRRINRAYPESYTPAPVPL